MSSPAGWLPTDTSAHLAVEDVPDLVTAVRRAAARWPDRPAWTFPDTGERLSFAEVAARSARIAGGLALLGVGSPFPFPFPVHRGYPPHRLAAIKNRAVARIVPGS